MEHLLLSQWIKDDSGWHYVDAAGNAVRVGIQRLMVTWYFIVRCIRQSSVKQIDGGFTFDSTEQDCWHRGWYIVQQDSWSWATEDGYLLFWMET